MVKLIGFLLPSLTILPLVSLAPVSRAHACGPPMHGFVHSRQMIPADGSTSVPTNVRIVLAYETTHPGITDHPRLQSADGSEITVNVTQPLNNISSTPYLQTFVMVPAVPLVPNTKYKVLTDFGTVPCIQKQFSTGMGSTPLCTAGLGGDAPAIDAGAASAVAIASFTTGTGPDYDPPVLPGVLTYTKGTSLSCNSSVCCGPYLGYTMGFNWNKATDANGLVYYELVYEQSTILLPVLEAALNLSVATDATIVGSLLCSGSFISYPIMFGGARFVATPGLFQVFAVDLAGNRSHSVSVTVPNDCGSTLDGGVDALPDSGGTGGSPLTADEHRDAASDGSQSPSDNGCSCRLGGGQGGSAGFALFALGMLLTRRLRRRR